MASAIAWTEDTWNPVAGCDVTSPGCTNCYAMRKAAWITRMGGPAADKYRGLVRPSRRGPVWTGELRLWEPAIDQPMRWARPRMIFVNSMSDLGHEAMPVGWFGRIWAAMVEAQQSRGHIFQVLTKRPANLARLLDAIGVTEPQPGVWIGVSAEDQRRWDERVPLLRGLPGEVRWVSVEPQLAAIERDPAGLDWIVVGGESGSQARPFDLAWARAWIAACRAAAVPVFVKQIGAAARDGGRPHATRRAGTDPAEWPADLRVREYPPSLGEAAR